MGLVWVGRGPDLALLGRSTGEARSRYGVVRVGPGSGRSWVDRRLGAVLVELCASRV